MVKFVVVWPDKMLRLPCWQLQAINQGRMRLAQNSVIMLLSAAWLGLALSSTASAECLDDLKAVQEAERAAGPYQVSATLQQNGQDFISEMYVNPPSAYYLQADGEESIEMEDGYWALEDGVWTKVRDTGGSMVIDSIKIGLVGDLDTVSEVSCPEPETQDGKKFSVFKYTLKSQIVGLTVTKTVKLLANDNRLPVFVETETAAGNQKTMLYSQIFFDPEIKVTPPE
jgi:hypothetical protein